MAQTKRRAAFAPTPLAKRRAALAGPQRENQVPARRGDAGDGGDHGGLNQERDREQHQDALGGGALLLHARLHPRPRQGVSRLMVVLPNADANGGPLGRTSPRSAQWTSSTSSWT
eukprot:8617865-Pyramimonas_sp.AAC.2